MTNVSILSIKTPVSRDIFGITQKQILAYVDRDQHSSYQLVYQYFKELEKSKNNGQDLSPDETAR